MQKLPHTILVKAIPSLLMMVHFGNSNIIQFAIFLTIFRVFAINACNKKNIIYTLSITSQAFISSTLFYVSIIQNDIVFITAYAHLLLYFFFYSFVGWIWESSYVSILTKRLTNRGFLTGPMLPIYGSGAVVMLCATYPVQSSDIGIFLLGLIAATILEYVTGVVMETLFQVRYWDYSDKKFNIQGHICLSSSLAWGVFTLLLIRVVHPRISALLEKIPQNVCFSALVVITIVFAIDFASSFHAAMDLRQILESITNLKSDAEKLRERFIVLTDSVSETLRDKIGTIKKPESSRIEEFQTSVSEYLEKLYSLVPKEKTADVIRLKERFAYLGELKNAISKRMDFRKIILLKGNPMLTSKKYADALK